MLRYFRLFIILLIMPYGMAFGMEEERFSDQALDIYSEIEKAICNADVEKVRCLATPPVVSITGAGLTRMDGTLFHKALKESLNPNSIQEVPEHVSRDDKIISIFEILLEAGFGFKNRENIALENALDQCLAFAIDNYIKKGRIDMRVIKLFYDYGADSQGGFMWDEQITGLYDSPLDGENEELRQRRNELINKFGNYAELYIQARKSPTKDALNKSIQTNYVYGVKLLLLKGFLPRLEDVQALAKNNETKQLWKLLLPYVRLLYSYGPINTTGIFSMCAIENEEVIVLPPEVVSHIITYAGNQY